MTKPDMAKDKVDKAVGCLNVHKSFYPPFPERQARRTLLLAKMQPQATRQLQRLATDWEEVFRANIRPPIPPPHSRLPRKCFAICDAPTC